MFKNVASQKIVVFAWDNAAGAPKTGDAANISAQISKDGGATAATNDVAPTELDATDAKGIYLFDMTQAETNADLVILSAVSSTADIDLQPVIIYTVEFGIANLNLGIIFGTAQTGTLSITQCTSDLTGYTANQLIGRVIIFTSGPADGEATEITDYDSTNGLITFAALTLAPENGNAFKIV